MTYALLALAVLYLLDAVRLRGRAAKLHVLAESDAAPDPDHVFWTAQGRTLDETSRRSASAWASESGLEVLDLWPANLDAAQTLATLRRVDPEMYRRRIFSSGRTAGQALLVRRDLAARSGLQAPSDPLAFAQAAVQLRRYARGYGMAVARELEALPEDPRFRLPLLREQLGPFLPLGLLVQLLSIALPLLAFVWSIPAGLALLLAFSFTPWIATCGTPLRPKRTWLSPVFRLPLELWAWTRALIAPRGGPPSDPGDALRAQYASLLSGGVERFLEPPRKDCPLCDDTDLQRHIRAPDMAQGKPGRFRLDRCRSCGHIFQNPRLSPEGLAFYYRDCYDGLARAGTERAFEASEPVYVSRAQRLVGFCESGRWLDVGAGYGHFGRVAGDVLAQMRLDGLDLGDGVDEAARRGWIEKAFRGPLPAVAGQLRASYDVVSMFHYLEHTRDPRAELEAAHTVLKPNGYLLLEIPNPDCPLARPLGQWWWVWFQPQHLHMFNAANLERLLAETGFAPVRWHWREAHVVFNFVTMALVWLIREAPPYRAPWRPRGGALSGLRAPLVWTFGPLVLLPAFALDLALWPILDRPGWTTNFGVLARRRP